MLHYMGNVHVFSLPFPLERHLKGFTDVQLGQNGFAPLDQ